MGEHNKSNEVILLFDTYSTDSQSLHTSFKLAGYNYTALVIEDDGFLPEDVISIYSSFLGDFEKREGVPGKPRYFNQIQVPAYWEISGNNNSGKVNDLSRERGKIFYAEPVHKRLVKTVDWYDEKGVVRSSDHYNRYGALYARTIFNAKGQRVNKSWFSADGREIIVQNYVTGDIILNDEGTMRFFQTKTEFVVFFFKRMGLEPQRIFFNSLSIPFFVSNRVGGTEKRDILFWQEPVGNEIPGNMQMIFRGEAGRTAEVVVQKDRSFTRLLELGAPAEKVHRLGYIYPFKRKNKRKANALICTNSDHIEHCQEIVKALPEMHFHIAAITEMSSKLMGLETYENISLYPNIKTDILKELFERCDYYFDINYSTEIVSAVRRAFLNNQLIFAFEETIHNRDYIAKEQIYPAKDAERMVADIKMAMKDVSTMARRLKKQREAALVEHSDSYKRLIETCES